MNRTKLGIKMLEWHDSQHDPIYMVGSFYIDNKVYPDKSVVERALSSLARQEYEFQRMHNGESVMVMRGSPPAPVSLKKFGGYSDSQVLNHRILLMEIIVNLHDQMCEDYGS